MDEQGATTDQSNAVEAPVLIYQVAFFLLRRCMNMIFLCATSLTMQQHL
jgi:hypothetical protein